MISEAITELRAGGLKVADHDGCPLLRAALADCFLLFVTEHMGPWTPVPIWPDDDAASIVRRVQWGLKNANALELREERTPTGSVIRKYKRSEFEVMSLYAAAGIEALVGAP